MSCQDKTPPSTKRNSTFHNKPLGGRALRQLPLSSSTDDITAANEEAAFDPNITDPRGEGKGGRRQPGESTRRQSYESRTQHGNRGRGGRVEVKAVGGRWW